MINIDDDAMHCLSAAVRFLDCSDTLIPCVFFGSCFLFFVGHDLFRLFGFGFVL
jgi:hypothetical protein